MRVYSAVVPSLTLFVKGHLSEDLTRRVVKPDARERPSGERARPAARLGDVRLTELAVPGGAVEEIVYAERREVLVK